MDSKQQQNRLFHWLYMAGLILAGESIYMLPYLRKTFQTSMEAIFELNSSQVGLLNSMFGLLAVAGYFPSGWLADRFSARRLLTFSLVTTSIGGFFMLTLPSYFWLLVIHAFWGVTSILTFWAALIKATRYWGRPDNQGASFGLLDAGRGAVAAILASLATAVFGFADSVRDGLQGVLLLYALAPLLTGILVWRVLPDSLYRPESTEPIAEEASRDWRQVKRSIREAVRKSEIWLLALIVFCAYMLYLGTFDLPAFAERGYERSKTFGATLGALRDWMRPLGAIAAGLIADRFRTSSTLGVAFAVLLLTFGSLSLIEPDAGEIWVLWSQSLTAALAVFALRGIYFAMLEEASISVNLTGITIGLVSLVGFTPDLFAHLLSGWFVDYFQGAQGYRYYFGFLSFISLIGIAATVAAIYKVHGKKALMPQEL